MCKVKGRNAEELEGCGLGPRLTFALIAQNSRVAFSVTAARPRALACPKPNMFTPVYHCLDNFYEF